MNDRRFNPVEFIARAGQRLVAEFDDASMAGTPGLIGSAKEHPARKQLERLLPQTASIGSGLIIDSSGNVSKQQDIVVYERNNCPVFSINETPEATYYPFEGVIAVGEVKSTMNSRELEDGFEKIKSAKRLVRHIKPSVGITGSTIAFRKYGSTMALVGTDDEQFDQQNKGSDQLFGFILCAKFGLTDDTVHLKAKELWDLSLPHESPNLIVSLNDGFILPSSSFPNSIPISVHGASEISFCKEAARGFPFLIGRLSWIIRNGRTVEVEIFERYLRSKPDENETFSVRRFPLAPIAHNASEN